MPGVVALGVGAVINILIILVGAVSTDADVSALGVIFGTFFSAVLVLVLQFFIHNLNYSRTEYVQFEDDEYYYYVKAVPKNTVALTEKKVKKIKGSEKSPQIPVDEEAIAEKLQLDAPEYRLRRSGSTAGNKNRTRRINIPEGTENNKT